MAVPRIFATHAAGNVPASYLDQDFAFVNTGIIPGVSSGGFSAWADKLLELNAGDLATLEYTADGGGQLTGIYNANVSNFLGLSTRISAADDPPNFDGATTGGVPRTALTTLITNSGSVKASVGALTISNCTASNTAGFGANPVAMTTISDGTVQLSGMEIDVLWPTGTTVANAAGSSGLHINGFGSNHCGDAIFINAVAGTWDNGIAITSIRTDGAGLYAIFGATMNTLIDTRGGTYTTSAMLLANEQFIRFEKAATGLCGLIYAAVDDVFTIDSDANILRFQGASIFTQSTASIPAEFTSSNASNFSLLKATTKNSHAVQMGSDGNGGIFLQAVSTIGAGTTAFTITHGGGALMTMLGNGQTGFTGEVITPAGTTAAASLRVPHGSAPTSPVDGDMWTTSSGLFVRISGSTIGPLS